MACNCNRDRGPIDDASIDYLLDMVKPVTNPGESYLLDIEDPLIDLLIDLIKEKAQYLNEAGLEYLIRRLRQKYVERVPDKGLSTNDFNNEYKNKLDGLPSGDELKSILDSINSAEWEVVSSLPSTGKPGTFYLVKLATPPSADNQYAEYIWVNGKWELLGVMSVSGNGLVSSIVFNGTTYKPDSSGKITLPAVDLSGYLPITGGTLTGNLRIKGTGNYGMKLNFGDGEYVYLYEDTDDHLKIYAKSGVDIGPTVSINGTALDTYIKNIADGVTPDLTGVVKSLTLNGSTISPSATGVAALGALCKTITMNGSSKAVGTTGTIALGGVCTKITLNGTTYNVSTTGTIALGTIESGGSANAIHTGTTVPATSLGSDGDFYYKMK